MYFTPYQLNYSRPILYVSTSMNSKHQSGYVVWLQQIGTEDAQCQRCK